MGTGVSTENYNNVIIFYELDRWWGWVSTENSYQYWNINVILFYELDIECDKRDVSSDDEPDKKYPNVKYRKSCYEKCKNDLECQFWAHSYNDGCW